MAAQYEEFLKRIQEGLEREENKEKTEANRNDDSIPTGPARDLPPPHQPKPKQVPVEVPSPQQQQQLGKSKLTSFKEIYEEICQQIRNTGVLDVIMQDFQECRTDFDRVSYVSQLTGLEDLNLEENYAQKSHEDACNYENVFDLLIPNEASSSKALDVMKKCIQKTPPEDVAALAVRHMKRGWASLLSAHFDDAAADAKKSLSFGHPEENLWNAHEILGHANAHHKDYKQAEYHFLKALENLRKSNTANEVKASVTVRIMTVFKTVKSKKNKKKSNKDSSSKKLPKVAYGAHPSFPCASSALDFVCSKERGRFVIAKRDIKPGDVLIVDSPYCDMLNPDYLTSHCYNCYQRAPVPIPCNSCAKVCYCCEECRDASWNGSHATECKVLNHLIDPGIGKIAILAFRVLTTLTWTKLHKIREKVESVIQSEAAELVKAQESLNDSVSSILWEGSYSSDNYMTVLLLANNANKRTFGDLFKRAITAVFLAKCLRLSGYFGSGECSEDDLLFVASLLLRHLQGGSCNAYEISEYELGVNGVRDAKTLEVGGALYTTISLTNHSCFNNATRYNIGSKCILSALRPISKGSEIFDNYGYYYYKDTFNERQEVLLNQYKFQCMCEPCTHMWSLYPHHPTEILVFRCPASNCNRPCCYSNTSRSKCNMCGNQEQYTRLLKELEIQLSRYKDAVSKLAQGDVRSALPVFISHMEFIDRHTVLPIKHYSDTQEAISQCLNLSGNVHKPPESIPIAESQQRSTKLKAGKNKFVTPKPM